jgi:hypothetical protein
MLIMALTWFHLGPATVSWSNTPVVRVSWLIRVQTSFLAVTIGSRRIESRQRPWLFLTSFLAFRNLGLSTVIRPISTSISAAFHWFCPFPTETTFVGCHADFYNRTI